MRFYFTKSNLIGSKAIRWALGEDCSHVAFRLDLLNVSVPIVIESRLDRGVFVNDLPGLLEINTIVHELRLSEPDPSFEEALYRSFLANAVGRRYDAKAFWFWTLTSFAKRTFGRPVPDKNPWGTRKDHLCVEVVRGSESVLEAGLGISLAGIDFEMMSPYGLYNLLAASPRLTKG